MTEYGQEAVAGALAVGARGLEVVHGVCSGTLTDEHLVYLAKAVIWLDEMAEYVSGDGEAWYWQIEARDARKMRQRIERLRAQLDDLDQQLSVLVVASEAAGQDTLL